MVKKMIYAEYIGSSVPVIPWKGTVQSIYSKAVNLFHPYEYLISIVDSIENMSDFGLVMKDFTLLLSKISNGNKFLWEGNQIIFSDIIIDLSKASSWSGVIFGNSFEINADFVPIKIAFSKFAVEEGLSPVVTLKVGNIYSNAVVKKLKEASDSADILNGLLIDLSSLVGMGIGFTPSGDDFLAGIMLYEDISGSTLIDREKIRIKLPGTTAGGRTLLLLALKNSFPFYLKQFADSIYTGDIYSGEAIRRAINHGSTSGSDALAGFLWAAEKIEKSD